MAKFVWGDLPPLPKKRRKIEKSELSEMARNLIQKKFKICSDFFLGGDIFFGGGVKGGDLVFLRAQTREARTPLVCASI
jgi:hypothetical protein